VVRHFAWVDQARCLLESELPADHLDTERPELASVKFAALCIEIYMRQSGLAGKILPILDQRRWVRVWFMATRRRVEGFAIEASYDGGRTFEDPLSRYQAFVKSPARTCPPPRPQ
jgi:hypothetical protein